MGVSEPQALAHFGSAPKVTALGGVEPPGVITLCSSTPLLISLQYTNRGI